MKVNGGWGIRQVSVAPVSGLTKLASGDCVAKSVPFKYKLTCVQLLKTFTLSGDVGVHQLAMNT